MLSQVYLIKFCLLKQPFYCYIINLLLCVKILLLIGHNKEPEILCGQRLKACMAQ
jgi:hypothetical protein